MLGASNVQFTLLIKLIDNQTSYWHHSDSNDPKIGHDFICEQIFSGFIATVYIFAWQSATLRIMMYP